MPKMGHDDIEKVKGKGKRQIEADKIMFLMILLFLKRNNL